MKLALRFFIPVVEIPIDLLGEDNTLNAGFEISVYTSKELIQVTVGDDPFINIRSENKEGFSEEDIEKLVNAFKTEEIRETIKNQLIEMLRKN